MGFLPHSFFKLPKAGNSPGECEDDGWLSYPLPIISSNRSAANAAVSDGATESAFAREWANILVHTFCRRPPDLPGLTKGGLLDWLAPAQEEWHGRIPWERIPWHGEAKARAGAFATLLGLTIASEPNGGPALSWQALAVGDSCLFVIRDDRLRVSFPLEDPVQFGNTPDLACSNPDNTKDLWDSVRRADGECVSGDSLILASDALACWFLERSAEGQKPWRKLLAMDSTSWVAWVEKQRRAGLMRNDDMTLVVIRVA